MMMYDKLAESRTVELYLDMVNSDFRDYSDFKKKYNPGDTEKFKPIGEMARAINLAILSHPQP